MISQRYKIILGTTYNFTLFFIFLFKKGVLILFLTKTQGVSFYSINVNLTIKSSVELKVLTLTSRRGLLLFCTTRFCQNLH
jgi:hypothetical protein